MTKQVSRTSGTLPRNELRGLDEQPRLYHVWFSTKLRKHLLVGDVGEEAKQLLRAVAVEKGIDLRELETMPEHVHLMLLSTREALMPQAKLLKGISARRLFQQFPGMKLDARTDHFWQRGFGYREIEDDGSGVAWYIRTQMQRLEKYER